jgi:DNA polymerase I-like protein with 3'-5' exonuclease and polymerase domains
MLMNLIGVKSEESLKKLLMSNDKFAELLRTRGIDPPTKISPKTGKQAWAFAKTDEALTSLGDSEDPIVATLVATRLDSRSTITETRTDSFIGVSERGAYPFSLLYSGAKVTHRWSGFDTNPQNLPRGSTLRKALMAAEGHTLVVADLSNIELRVGMWVAGEMSALKLLGEGGDLYKEFASKAFDVPYDKVTKEMRFVGKTSQLGLIFGVGAAKLRGAVKAGAVGIAGIDLGEEESKRIVDLYRDTYTGVTALWKTCTTAIKAIADDDTFAFGTRDLYIVEGKKGIKFPSGMYMQYPELEHKINMETGERGYKYKMRNGYDRL